MLPFTQRNRLAAIISPLGEDALGLISFQGRESISQPFEYVAQVISRDANLDFDKLVGAPVMLRLETMRGGRRFFSGIVNRLEQVASQKHYARYQLTIVPWLWFLTRCSDCHIYQDKTVPQILEEVLKRHQLGDYELRLTGKYHPKEYCVQYRETDFNFVSRLMEQEGIYYYHVHTKSKHILVIADSPGAHESRKGYEELLYRPGDSSKRDLEQILGWTIRREAQSGAFEHRDYDFKAPSKDLIAHSLVRRKHDLSKGEVFDFPGGFVAHDEGRQYAKVRLQEMQVRHAVVQGEADARGLATGFVFKLKEHPRKDQCGKHLVIDTQINVRVGEYESEDASERDDSPFFHCSFRVVDAEEQLRPERRTPKPVVQGPQTAIVVGPPGAEIHVDEHARVRVHFHWDRHHEATAEDSSCWMRVSQPWAGKGYGGMNIPRVGQEVVVEFLEGDPDRPLINGRLYNGESMPHASNAGRDGKEGNKTPTGIPEAAMMTSFKSNSFGGSGGHNEITMNDAAGKEGLFLKAQKDEIHKVGNDREDSVANNEQRNVGVNRTRSVGKDESVTIGNNRTKDVGNDETTTIGNNHTVSVATNETITVGANQTVTIGANQTTSIGANHTISVAANETNTVNVCRLITTLLANNDLAGVVRGMETGVVRLDLTGMAMADIIGLARFTLVGLADMQVTGMNKIEKVGMSHSLSTGQATNVKAGTDFIVEAGAKAGIKAGSKLVFECPDITLTAGGSFIRIDGSGVTIVGSKVKINSGGSAGSLSDAPAAAAGSAPADGKAGPAKPGDASTPKAPNAPTELKTDFAKLLDKLGVPSKYTKVLDQLLTNPLDVKFDDLKAIAPSWDELIKYVPKDVLPDKMRGVLGNLMRYLTASQFAPDETAEQKKKNEADAKAALDAIKKAIKEEGEKQLKDQAKKQGIDISGLTGGDEKKPDPAQTTNQPGAGTGSGGGGGGSSSGGGGGVSHLTDPNATGSGGSDGAGTPATPSFDPDKAASHAADNAADSPGGNCASATREAIEAGGIKVDRTASAKDYGPNLEKAGFDAIDADENSYTPQKGDVVVFQDCPGHPDGHMQIYDGTQFVSDFKQKDKLWPSSSANSSWKTNKPSFQVYRYPKK